MKLPPMFAAFAALAMVPVAAHAEEAKKAAPDYIPFANHGGVRDWQAGDRDTVYFQDRQKRWYKAELIGSASDLPFTLFIGIDSGPSDRLDKWSSVYVRGQRYALASFEPIEGAPPKKAKKAKKEDAG